MLTAGLATLAAPAQADDAAATKNLERFIKMRGTLGDSMVIGSVTGQYNGVVDGKTTALFGLVSAVFSRYRRRPGGFEITEFEQAYYTDLETGAVLDRWKNPYTNEVITVPTYDGSVDTSFLSPTLQFRSAKTAPANVRARHYVQGPNIAGGTIAFTEGVDVSVAPSSGKPGFSYRDHTILRANLAAVDSNSETTGSRTHFEANCSWRPWLHMGAHPGNMTAAGAGSFGATMAELPAAWVNATSRLKPDLLKNPGKNLE
jgi:hypothetical protein